MAQYLSNQPQAEVQNSSMKQLGSYIVSKTLGQGLMEVKLAMNPTENNKQYAVKVCQNGFQRLNLEAEATLLEEINNNLNIPNVVGFKEYVLAGSSKPNKANGSMMVPEDQVNLPELEFKCALILEYAPNYTMFDYLSLENPFDDKLARTYMQKLVQTLFELHNNGITHRDVKPENLLLDKDFNMLLADFGYAQKFDKLQGDRSKIRVGTESYMCPEMFTPGKSYSGCKADVFACGVILFTMLWGRPPFFCAKSSDPFYKYFASGNSDKYWHIFETKLNNNVEYDRDLKELLNAIFSPDEKERPTMEELSQFRWLNQEVYTNEELAEIMNGRKQQLDADKQKVE